MHVMLGEMQKSILIIKLAVIVVLFSGGAGTGALWEMKNIVFAHTKTLIAALFGT